MRATTLYVFSGKFGSRAEACHYSEPQWEPEPPETASDEEYAHWEDNNPTHKLRANLPGYLDSDFIETINGSRRHDYLAGMLIDPSDIDEIIAAEPEGANVFILISEEALGGSPLKSKPVSTQELKFCGRYQCRL